VQQERRLGGWVGEGPGAQVALYLFAHFATLARRPNECLTHGCAVLWLSVLPPRARPQPACIAHITISHPAGPHPQGPRHGAATSAAPNAASCIACIRAAFSWRLQALFWAHRDPPTRVGEQPHLRNLHRLMAMADGDGRWPDGLLHALLRRSWARAGLGVTVARSGLQCANVPSGGWGAPFRQLDAGSAHTVHRSSSTTLYSWHIRGARPRSVCDTAPNSTPWESIPWES
jgi:hypothetical protein